MPGTAPDGNPGLLNSLTRLVATLLSAAQTRLEMLSIDLEQSREDLLRLIALAFLASLSLGLGVVMASLAMLVAFWDSHPVLALAGLSVMYLALGSAVAGYALRCARATPRIFASSLAELSRDRQQLVSPP